MQFLFYSSEDARLLDSFRKNIPEGYDKLDGEGFSVFYKNVSVTYENDELTLIKGFVHPAGNTDCNIRQHVRNQEWPLTHISGQFALLQYKTKQYVNICTDTIGMYPLYYHVSPTGIAIGTLPTHFKLAGFHNLDYTGIISRMMPTQYQTWGKRTVLKDVNLLLPGEFIHFDLAAHTQQQYYDTTISGNNHVKTPKQIAAEYGHILEQEAIKTLAPHNDIYLGLSGGVDSRVLLSVLQYAGKDIKCVSYGKDDYLDVKIAKRIAGQMGYSYENFDPIPYLFPDKDLLFKYAIETDSILVTPWLAITEGLKNKVTDYPVFLIGDICDMLRAKNITSFTGRDFRIKATLEKVFLGKTLKLTPFNGNMDFIEQPAIEIIKRYMPHFAGFISELGLSASAVQDELISDIHEESAHLKRYDLEYMENCQELAGVFHHGRLGMGTQIRILSETFTPISLMSNMASTRYILNIHPLSRLADTVTHPMLQTQRYKKLGAFPTAQAPFVNYNNSFYTVMFFWMLRSKTDQYLTRKMVKKKQPGRNRLFPSLNYYDGYSDPKSESNLRSYFSEYPSLAPLPLKLFTRRKELTKTPLTNTDIVSYTQALAYLEYFNFDKKF